MIASALLILAAVKAAQAQGVVSLFPVGFMDDGLQGTVIGTGADGTTYRLSATFDELGVPYTMTLVEDATHVSITADLATAGITVPVNVQCAMGGGEAVCREVVGTGIEATTITESGAVALTPVPVDGVTGGGSLPTGTSTRSTSIGFSSSSANGGVLGPTLSSPTATLNGPTETSGDSNIPGLDSGSGAMKTFGTIALGCAVIPALMAFVNTLL